MVTVPIPQPLAGVFLGVPTNAPLTHGTTIREKSLVQCGCKLHLEAQTKGCRKLLATRLEDEMASRMVFGPGHSSVPFPGNPHGRGCRVAAFWLITRFGLGQRKELRNCCSKPLKTNSVCCPAPHRDAACSPHPMKARWVLTLGNATVLRDHHSSSSSPQDFYPT